LAFAAFFRDIDMVYELRLDDRDFES
jgi:hypothetical protein